MTELSCKSCGLTTLDANNCYELKSLYCPDNQLTALDLSYCYELKNLYCPDNQLTSLNLRYCEELSTLSCNNNQLTALDVSIFPGLEYLYCDNNRLTSLDVSACPSLLELHCDGNQLTALNLSGCTNLWYLYCGNNRLTSLDLSDCRELYSLDCTDNQLTVLDISSCRDLIDTYINGTKSIGDKYCVYSIEGPNTYLAVDKATTILTEPLTKPVITTQPKSVTATAGSTAKFTVAATDATSYQWQYRTSSTGSWNNSTASSAKTATLSITAESYRSGYQYRCKVTNSAGTTTSNAATLTVVTKPTITTQPKSVSTTLGSTAKFTVAASGGSLSYQWQWRSSSSGTWKDCTSATTGYNKATLQVSATSSRNGYQYRCKVTNAAGTATSSTVTLTVTSSKPTITTQPTSKTAAAGSTAKFSVAATGATSYQWQWRSSSSGTWADCTSATTGYHSGTLQVSATTARNGYQYRCKVTNSAGTTTSNTVTLTVVTKPTITTQPTNKTATAGTTVKFTVAATGGALSYQWQFRSSSSASWSNCSGTGATTATLSVEAKAYRNGYQYRCLVFNVAGSVYSNTVTLTVK